jgi:hypothetical protein
MTLPGAMPDAIWKDGQTALAMSGIIGAAILSTDHRNMPPALEQVFKDWAAANGGCISCFTARKTCSAEEYANLPETTKIAAEALSEEDAEELIAAISDTCPMMSFGDTGMMFILLARTVNYAVGIFKWLTPDFVKKSYEKHLEILARYVPSLLGYSMALILAYTVGTCNGGFLTSYFWNVSLVLMVLIRYLFGSTFVFIFVVAVVLFISYFLSKVDMSWVLGSVVSKNKHAQDLMPLYLALKEGDNSVLASILTGYVEMKVQADEEDDLTGASSPWQGPRLTLLKSSKSSSAADPADAIASVKYKKRSTDRRKGNTVADAMTY